MSNNAQVVSVNVSELTGTIKHPVDEIVLDARGITGDAHAGLWHRQVSLLGQESIDQFVEQTGRETRPGEFAENITVRGVASSDVALLDRFRIGPVELEITQIGKTCHQDKCAIFREVGKCVMPKEGLFTRVIHPGTVRAGDPVEHIAKTWKVLVITLSDRAFHGEYTDRSGPRAKEMIEVALSGLGWRFRTDSVLLPDDKEQLTERLIGAKTDGVDMIFTLGGTGIGIRDIAPETVAAVCDRIIPGIMEHIRIKFAGKHPSSLLSRSLAGIAGETIIYTLPGSVRAVEEYLGEILPALEHTMFMMHGVDVH